MHHKQQALSYSFYYLIGFVLLILNGTFYSSYVLAETACGEPKFDPASGAAVRIWQDCKGSGEWHVRATGDVNGIRYSGSIISTRPITALNAFRLENFDQVYINGSSIIFDPLIVTSKWQDGFDFIVDDSAALQLTLSQPENTVVLLGVDQVSTTLPVTLVSGISDPNAPVQLLQRIKLLESTIATLRSALDAEVSARITADETEADTRSYADEVEIIQRTNAVTILKTGIDIETNNSAARDNIILASLSRLDTTKLESRIVNIENNSVLALDGLLSYNGRTMTALFQGVNVQVTNGSGSTSHINGLGNLIVGYNAYLEFASTKKNGSHNLVVGDGHDYTNYGGFVAGFGNSISGRSASVCGGLLNSASGIRASVSGGENNTASGYSSSISGGELNKALGARSSVSGGVIRKAFEMHDWVAGALFEDY